MPTLGEYVSRYVAPTLGGVGIGGMLYMEGEALVKSFKHVDQMFRVYGDTVCLFGLLLVVAVAIPIIF